ncbi:hypothetical protein KO516_18550 [Citreicella sp. C3M06]|uniref:hypothetical protein n=1 Tax=Citreicella sp. C3M06 TaxID=2841564 RepID=UPI001C08A881|nr:hypothetical protein [Citreicella sp. C3M06]MBU2962787.1 hypothetical protein [Citreicella sp. C3M06]
MTDIILAKRFAAAAVALGPAPGGAQAPELHGRAIHMGDAPAAIAKQSLATNLSENTGNRIQATRRPRSGLCRHPGSDRGQTDMIRNAR